MLATAFSATNRFEATVDLHHIMKICKAYDCLGWAVQEQLVSLIDGETDQNPNAIKYIARFASTLPDEAKHELEELVKDFEASRTE